MVAKHRSVIDYGLMHKRFENDCFSKTGTLEAGCLACAQLTATRARRFHYAKQVVFKKSCIECFVFFTSAPKRLSPY